MTGAAGGHVGAPTRLGWIEGLRGLAALQVVFLHYTSVFLPVLARVEGPAHYAWEASLSHSPWFFLIDGAEAVSLFFVMSGFVLAQSFAASRLSFTRQAIKRFLRLYLPVLAACLLSLGLLTLLPGLKSAAFAHTQSGWLKYNFQNPLTFGPVLHDIALNSMLLGYRDLSLFSHIGFMKPLLPPIAMALDAPLWTLHIEFWGSLLTLGLVLLARRRPRRLIPALGCLFLILGTDQLSLFLVGMMLGYATRNRMLPIGKTVALAGVTLISVGIAVCGADDIGALQKIFALDLRLGLLHAPDNMRWQSEVGAMLIFIGAFLCKPAQRLLSCRPILWLGKISFSIYLIHFPILYTLALAFYRALGPMPYLTAFAATTIFGILLTLALAWLFERIIDRGAIRLAKCAVNAAPR